MNLKDKRAHMSEYERKMNEALDDLMVLYLRKKDGLGFDNEVADSIIKEFSKYNLLRKLEKEQEEE